ncbi:hypothetical protein ASPWEDRAFT_69172 [Aspergillus wentii DTO 134E9]|uniref:Uncharacterized protein n=1 Tax=Aspergillus wentii DTO 134E9 TaxID=1073089 RepID=A0A1L9RLZ1_ASPWE|nr:uncharacterized protein ASPWEDRAFT_69172 [Aspergillus wentii DTO 134E9]OJJ35914.1 hypothetical protein ASPWEDRAFT_69172 [Aspergillus wentii DTO 134E9]
MPAKNQLGAGTGPTDSHILSQEQSDAQSTEKLGEIEYTEDIGWNASSSEDIDETLVPGLSNEDVWMLVRRFNKTYYVKAQHDVPLQRLDLNRGENEEFSPDKLRATLERLYTTIIVSLMGFCSHIARLRSWDDFHRTSIFCGVYFTAWLLDLLAPTFFSFLLIIFLFPHYKEWAFPSTSKAQREGSRGSLTGASERFKGEADEQEASNLMTSVASVAVGSVAGKHDQGTPDDAPIELSVPDAMDAVAKTADAQTAAHGHVPDSSHDKTRQPMKAVVMEGANQGVRILSDIVDTYERFGNALSPTWPFSTTIPTIRIASVLTSAIILSLVMSNYVLVKIGTFTFGLAFFGDPIIMRTVTFLNRKYPSWTKLLELRNSLLKGIPTNAQLALTILRIGEANGTPLPPPPKNGQHKAESSKDDHQEAAGVQPQHHQMYNIPKPKGWMSGMIGFFRGTTATGIESKLAIDRVRAAAGSKQAKNRVGVLHRKGRQTLPSGPCQFDTRYKGKRGIVVIDASLDPPALYFTTDPTAQFDQQLESRSSGSVMFTMPVTEIQEMRKIGGLGWKGKIITGWAVGSKEVVDGLTIVGKQQQTYRLTAMKLRNELFNRLVAIDGQVWETC